MSQLVKYVCDDLENVEKICIVINDEPRFKGTEVAKVLGYKYTSDAVKDHVPLKYKHKLSFLLRCSKIGKTPTMDVSELNTAWISEAGLYRLILKSRAKSAEVFQDWVGEDVLPQTERREYIRPCNLATK